MLELLKTEQVILSLDYNMSRADFRVIANSTDIIAAIRRSMLSLRVTDEVGVGSDKVEIRLDDRGGGINLLGACQ